MASTLRGTPAYTAAKFGNGLSGGVLQATGILNGTVTAADGADITTATLTVECWAKGASTSGARVAVGKDSIWWLGHDANGNPAASFGGSGGGGTTQVLVDTSVDMRSSGTFHHLALVVERGIARLYRDGVLRAVAPTYAKNGTGTHGNGIGIGGFISTSTFDWAGQVDDVACSTAAQYTTNTFPVPTSQHSASRPDQVALFRLEDASDSDTAATVATVTRGTPAYAPAKFGNGLSGAVLTKAGLLNSVVPAANTNWTSTFTIEGWMKSSAASGTNRVGVGKLGAFWLGHDGNGKPFAELGDSGTNGVRQQISWAAADMRDGAFHHLALVVDAGTLKLYVDGALRATAAGAAKLGTVTVPEDGVSIGGFGTLSTFDWNGQLDEISVSTVAKYAGSTYEVPTAPFRAGRSGQVALFRLEADGSDSDGTDYQPPTIGTVTLTHSGTTDTITYPAPTAGDTSVSSVALYRGTTSGGEAGPAIATNAGAGGGSFNVTSATSGVYYYVVRAIDSNGVESAASNEVAYPPPMLWDPTSTGYVFSPGNWDITATRALSNCGGAYVRTLITGALTSFEIRLNVDDIPASGKRSIISYRLDGGAWVDATVQAGTVTVTIPTAQQGWPKHLFEMVFKTSTVTVDRWASPYLTAVKFLGLYLPAGVTLTAPPRRQLVGLAYGDSITEGIGVTGSSGDETTRSDAKLGWAYSLTETLGAEIGVIGYGGSGVARPAGAGTGQVPPLTDTWDLHAAGLPRTLPADLDFIVVNIGTNDQRNSISEAAFTAAATALLNDLIAATSRSVRIVWLQPFGGYYSAAVHQAAIAACAEPGRVAYVETTGWWSTSDSADTLHPFGYISRGKLSALVAQAIRAALNAGRTYRKVAGALEAVRASRY